MVGLSGCAGDRAHQRAGHGVEENRTAEPDYHQITDQNLEDSRTAARVREALATGADYKFGGVKITACNGIVQLSGFVDTRAQRKSAGEIASKVVGVKSAENTLMVRD
jgi:osmotically-inducible protein OsmY